MSGVSLFRYELFAVCIFALLRQVVFEHLIGLSRISLSLSGSDRFFRLSSGSVVLSPLVLLILLLERGYLIADCIAVRYRQNQANQLIVVTI